MRTTQSRINKTMEAIRNLKPYLKNCKFHHMYLHRNGNIYSIISYRKINSFSRSMMTFTEVISMDNKYVWGSQVAFFCDVEKEASFYTEENGYQKLF